MSYDPNKERVDSAKFSTSVSLSFRLFFDCLTSPFSWPDVRVPPRSKERKCFSSTLLQQKLNLPQATQGISYVKIFADHRW